MRGLYIYKYENKMGKVEDKLSLKRQIASLVSGLILLPVYFYGVSEDSEVCARQ